MTSRLDGFVNTITQLGNAFTDKARANRVQAADPLSDEDLENLYHDDWLSRRIVEAYPAIALRSLSVPKSALGAYREINNNEENPAGELLKGLSLGRLFGGAVILLGCKSRAPLEAPLPEGARLEWLDVVPKHQLKAVEIDQDPASASFKRGLVFEITGMHRRSGTVFHRSRAVFCEGLTVAGERNARRSVAGRNEGFPTWISVLQPVWDAIAQYDLAWVSVGHLLQESSVGVFGLAGLIDMLATENQNVIEKRLAILSQSRSVAKVIAIDPEHSESYERENASFADLPLLMAQISQRLAGAADMPATVLFGMSPAGLNATGVSDLEIFYGKADTYRIQSVIPKLNRILSLIKPGAECEALPLSVPTAKEHEEIRNARANADRTWFDLGVVDEAEIRRSRARDGSLDLDVDPDSPPPIPPPQPTFDPNAPLDL